MITVPLFSGPDNIVEEQVPVAGFEEEKNSKRKWTTIANNANNT